MMRNNTAKTPLVLAIGQLKELSNTLDCALQQSLDSCNNLQAMELRSGGSGLS